MNFWTVIFRLQAARWPNATAKTPVLQCSDAQKCHVLQRFQSALMPQHATVCDAFQGTTAQKCHVLHRLRSHVLQRFQRNDGQTSNVLQLKYAEFCSVFSAMMVKNPTFCSVVRALMHKNANRLQRFSAMMLNNLFFRSLMNKTPLLHLFQGTDAPSALMHRNSSFYSVKQKYLQACKCTRRLGCGGWLRTPNRN